MNNLFTKLDVDYTGENPKNFIQQEQILDVKANTPYMLKHDIWFADTALFYTDINDIAGTCLVKDVDYRLGEQDQIACDQSGQICVRSLEFLKDYARIFVNYHVYGDLVQADDFAIMENAIYSLTTDDISEGKNNLYYQDKRVSESTFAQQAQTELAKHSQNLEEQKSTLQEFSIEFQKHLYLAADDETLGHIALKDGKIDPQLIPLSGNSSLMMVGSYLHFACENLPDDCVPLMGGILNPEDFADHLEIFKQRIPSSWILADGTVQLPNAFQKSLKMDPSYPWGAIPSNQEKKTQNYAALAVSVQEESTVSSMNLNTIITIVVGNLKNLHSYKTYYLIHPETQEYYGQKIRLAQTKENGEGIGYNPLIMKETPPAKNSGEKEKQPKKLH